MAKALIGTLWAFLQQSLHVRKKRVRSLSNIEALALPNRKISDVHAISANNHNYQSFDLDKEICEISMFF